MKKTKIVCTIGPESESLDVLTQLIDAGMNVCRINFSHGTHEEHDKQIKNIKKARKKSKTPIAIMLDTKGPEIRLGTFKNGPIEIIAGQTFILTTRDIEGDENIVSVSYKDLPKDVRAGTRVLIDDGLVEFVVEDIEDTEIKMRAVNYGKLSDRKGVNIPDAKINLPAITEKDIGDIKFGIERGIDYVAASFIRKASDALEIRKILEENGGEDIKIISKIESEEGVSNIDEILRVSDGIMVARGDLGVEVPTQSVPLVQKELIRKANYAGKPVITATQMLDSMIRNPRPTRAEVNDVANAILDGSDAVMLSGETAAGKYPVQSVEFMTRIAEVTENSPDFIRSIENRVTWKEATSTNAISRSTTIIAEQLDASAIVVATYSGKTAMQVSKFRPNTVIVASTVEEKTARALSLVWGVYPVLSKNASSTDELIERSVFAALNAGYVKQGDQVILTAGIPVGVGSSTNLIKVHTIGDIITHGQGIGVTSVVGNVCIGSTKDELIGKFKDGDIIVSKYTDKDIVEFIERSSGIIVEQGGLTSHAAIVAINLRKPAIIGVEDATKILEDGQQITLDTIGGLIYVGSAKVL